MELNPQNVHTADVAEIQERIDSVMKNDRLMRPEEGMERILAGLIAMSVVSRDYLGAPEVADRLRVVHTYMSNIYTLSYRRVILGKDPASEMHRSVSVSAYVSNWKDYREYSPKMRLEVVWDDVALLVRRVTMMFESVLAQKYRTYGADCSMYSVLALMYASIEILANMEPEIEELIARAPDTPINPDTDKLLVAEYIDETPIISPMAVNGLKGITYCREHLPTVQDALSAEFCTLGDIVFKTGESPVRVKSELASLQTRGLIQTKVDGDGITYYSLAVKSA